MSNLQKQMEALIFEGCALRQAMGEWQEKVDGFLKLSRWSRTAIAEELAKERAKARQFQDAQGKSLSRDRLLRVFMGQELNEPLLREMMSYALEHPKSGSYVYSMQGDDAKPVSH